MSFNPDNYDLKKLSEYPEIEFGNNLPDEAFFPAVSLDDQQALANYKISLAKLRDFIIQVGDYTNVIDYRPENYAQISGKQLIVPGGWRLEVPNGFLPTGEYKNTILNITESRTIEFGQVNPGLWSVFVTDSSNYLCLQSSLLVRRNRAQVTTPATGTIVYESDSNLWYRYTGSDWQQLTGMPLLNVDVSESSISVSLSASLMRNRLNLQYLLAQAGIEIPESRGPFERVITNVKKSGADLLYYIPAHTYVDLANYPQTLSLITAAHARAIQTEVKILTIGEHIYRFYRDDETGLDFADTLYDYSNHYDDNGTAPFIYYDGGTHIWTPKTSHGDLIYKADVPVADVPANANYTMSVSIYSDGWMEYTGLDTFASDSAVRTITFPFPFKDMEYKAFISFCYNLSGPTQYQFICPQTRTENGFLYAGIKSSSTGSAWRASGFAAADVINNIPNSDSHHEYYLLGNAATNIPADLGAQLATLLEYYNQVVQQQANFFSILASDNADALAKSIANPNKFVYTADS